MSSLPVKIKVLLILAENSSKAKTKLFPFCATSDENRSESQILFCELLRIGKVLKTWNFFFY